MASLSSHYNQNWEMKAQESEPILFSDEEESDSEWNYYTDEESESSSQEEEEQSSRFERAIRGFGALMVPIMVSAGLGVYLATLHAKKPPQAWFWGGSKSEGDEPVVLKKNELKGRCKAVQYPANDPCQDRLSCHQINAKGFRGFYAGVFDGNSGWQLAEDCSKKLHVFIEENLKNASTDDQVKEAIEKAFEQMEQAWLELAKVTFEKGFAQTAYVSSTALVVLVRD